MPSYSVNSWSHEYQKVRSICLIQDAPIYLRKVLLLKSFISSLTLTVRREEKSWRLSFFYPSIYYLIGIYSLLVLLVCLLKSFKELFLYSCLNSCLDCRFVLLVESVFLKSECKGTEIFSFHKTFLGKISIFMQFFRVVWYVSNENMVVTLLYITREVYVYGWMSK